ncbi:hypothetical protein [Rhizorhabdus dicambivorans]|uniref:Uncharacterized protein n=1 Tax=Rhizorhabdus dicambivorans TaxID=1850238 RepID=A0A2A4FQN5_9SPHN|nr:hypothetical protein [Rhizorhabdus dicambivorans]ATE65384.1 hypothetical protein CMV14_14040 [Rhizorhabdus dicambivorans]PCE39758.1 hypothetical protein COO09_23845 [Rhizorhabdus dicambivorans]
MLSTNKRLPQAAIAALVGLMIAGTAAAAPLVVRSAGPSAKAYPAGKALPDNAKIVLKAGDSIVLLDGRGTRTLSGPGTFSASGASTVASANAGSTLGALVSGGGERRARIGAVRSASGIDKNAGKNPNVWYVDVTRSTNMCIADPSTVTVWRPGSDAPATIKVSKSDGSSADIALAPGQAAALWPSTLPVTDGSSFKLSWDGAKAPTNVKFVVVKPTSPGLEDMAQSLIKAGCNAQLDLLIQTTSLPGGGNAG